MKYVLILIALIFAACQQQQTVNHDHDDIIEQDLANKQRELELLREIYIAQQNQDEESFKFFTTEYIRTPRLVLTPEQKQHPMYREWLTDKQILSGTYMSEEFNYIE